MYAIAIEIAYWMFPYIDNMKYDIESPSLTPRIDLDLREDETSRFLFILSQWKLLYTDFGVRQCSGLFFLLSYKLPKHFEIGQLIQINMRLWYQSDTNLLYLSHVPDDNYWRCDLHYRNGDLLWEFMMLVPAEMQRDAV